MKWDHICNIIWNKSVQYEFIKNLFRKKVSISKFVYLWASGFLCSDEVFRPLED